MSYTFLVAFVCLGLVTSDQPNLKLRVTKLGLDYANQEAAQILNDDISKIHIPDIHEEDIQAWNISVVSFDAPTYEYSLQPPATFSWGLTNGDISVKATVRVCKKVVVKLCDTVDVVAKADKVSLDITPTLGRTPAGQPSILAVQCKATIDKLDLDIKGGVIGWIADKLSHWLANSVKPKMEAEICDKGKVLLLTKVNQKLATLPFHQTIKGFDFDYDLVMDPVITDSTVEADLKGALTYPKDPTIVSPYPQTPLAEQVRQERMAYAWVSDKIINDFLYIIHQARLTNITLTENTPGIGPYLRLHCNQSFCLGSAFPDIAAEFPDTEAAELNAGTKSPPTLIIKNDGMAYITAEFISDLFITTPSRKSIVKMDMFVQADVQGQVENMTVTGQVDISNVTVQVLETMLSDQMKEELENDLPTLIKLILVPKINEKLDEGIKIPPIKGVDLPNLQFRLLERTIQLESDIKIE